MAPVLLQNYKPADIVYRTAHFCQWEFFIGKYVNLVILSLPKIYRPILKCENIYHLTAVRIEMYPLNIWSVDKALPTVNIPLTPVITGLGRGGNWARVFS